MGCTKQMKDFAQALTISGHPDAITAVIRVAPQYMTLQCLQDSLVHAEAQGKKLLERICKALGAANIKTNQPQEITFEAKEYWIYVFVGAQIRKGVTGLQTANNLRLWAEDGEGNDDPDDKVTDEEYELGQMFLYGDDGIWEGE